MQFSNFSTRKWSSAVHTLHETTLVLHSITELEASEMDENVLEGRTSDLEISYNFLLYKAIHDSKHVTETASLIAVPSRCSLDLVNNFSLLLRSWSTVGTFVHIHLKFAEWKSFHNGLMNLGPVIHVEWTDDDFVTLAVSLL